MEIEVDSPAMLMHRLAAIERDLAERQNELEEATRSWYVQKAEIEYQRAKVLLLSSRSSITEKKAESDKAVSLVKTAEGEFEALKRVIEVLKTRASVLQTVLNNQGKF
jgi:predicted  nucleic acid-binding Zn-ribbon protein